MSSCFELYITVRCPSDRCYCISSVIFSQLCYIAGSDADNDNDNDLGKKRIQMQMSQSLSYSENIKLWMWRAAQIIVWVHTEILIIMFIICIYNEENKLSCFFSGSVSVNNIIGNIILAWMFQTSQIKFRLTDLLLNMSVNNG